MRNKTGFTNVRFEIIILNCKRMKFLKMFTSSTKNIVTEKSETNGY